MTPYPCGQPDRAAPEKLLRKGDYVENVPGGPTEFLRVAYAEKSRFCHLLVEFPGELLSVLPVVDMREHFLFEKPPHRLSQNVVRLVEVTLVHRASPFG